jgi:hypothetical protein
MSPGAAVSSGARAGTLENGAQLGTHNEQMQDEDQKGGVDVDR